MTNAQIDPQYLDETQQNWRGLFRGNSPPFRSDYARIDQNRQLWLEHMPGKRVVIRQAGYFWDVLLGVSVSGRGFHEFFPTVQRDDIQRLLSCVYEQPSQLILNLDTVLPGLEMHFFPVRVDYGPLDYALGALNLKEAMAAPDGALSYVSAKTIGLRESKMPANASGFANARRQFEPKSVTEKYRVIEGGASGQTKKPELRSVQMVKREP